VNITLDISPEISFVGEKNDFMEVMGNVLDNACKYCLSLWKSPSGRPTTTICIFWLKMMAWDPAAMRSAVFDRGQRADTLRPGQGVGLSVARDIVAQYDGRILAEESLLGGACMEVIFGRQPWKIKRAKTVGFLTAPASCWCRIRYNP
jgi:two-component system sensor histidine kinase PhoQ